MRLPRSSAPPIPRNGATPSSSYAHLRRASALLALCAFAIVPGCGASDEFLDEFEEGALGQAEEAITAGTNIALGKPATASSIAFGGAPSRVVDGNTNGDFSAGSVAHTDIQINPWVQVDLQSSQFIGTVILWGRTDCCFDRLSDLRLRFSDDGATWQDIPFAGAVAKQATFAVNRSARYVRVELNGASPRYMNIAEIQVFGPPNLAQGKPATQSSTGAGGDPSRAVDGNTDGSYGNNSVTHTQYSVQPWWQVDLGAPQNVGIVELFNRTDCCVERLSNFKLLVSENGSDWTPFDYAGQAPSKLAFSVNRAARFVKVQLNGSNYLSLAEVRVFPMANAAITGGGAGTTPLGSYPTAPIGMLDGDFSVDGQGNATYSVPIKVPPGTRGVEPKLSLSYRSGGGNGPVGVGWSLAGMPMVARCPRTQAQDGVRGGINGDSNDRFCLDGQRLVAISGAYGANGTEYRTELNTFSRVYSYGTCGTGPCRFEVTDKSGNTVVLGETNVVPTFSDGTTPRSYSLKQLRDFNANYLTVSYTLDANQIYPQQILYTMHDAVPSMKKRRVGFEYETRTDKENAYTAGVKVTTAQRLSRIKTYLTTAQGEELVRDYRLTYATSGLTKRSLLSAVSECDAKGICLPASQFDYNSAGAGTSKFTQVTPTGTGISDYQDRMRYDPGAYLYPVDFSGDGRTDLLRVQHGPGTPTTCNLTEYFSTGNGYFNAFDPSGTSFSTQIDGDLIDLFPFDYNGDGKTDFIRREKGSWDDDAYNTFAVYVADYPAGFKVTYPGTQGNWGDLFQGLSGADGGTHIITGDYNGDGRGDFIRQEYGDWADNEPGITFNVAFSNGGTGDFFNVVTPQGNGYGGVLRGDYVHIITGDFNGDGKTDFIRRETGSWADDINMSFGVYYSKGDGTFDIYYPGSNASGDIFQDQLRNDIWTFANGFPAKTGTRIIPGDFNGDGKTDFIRQQWGGWTKNNTANSFNVYFSTGKNGNFERVTPSGNDYGGTLGGDYVDIFTFDYNGDGKTDFIRREKGGWDDDANYTFGIYVSNGDGTFEVIYPGTQGSWSDIYQGGCGSISTNILTGDFDGDGKGDFVRQEWDGADDDTNNTFNVFFANGDDAGDFLKKVTNGLGGTVDVTYASLNDSSVHVRTNGSAYPNVDFEGSMYVVRTTKVGDVGSTSGDTFTYGYYGARMSAEGRGFLGFDTMWQSGPNGTTQTQYHQIFPLTGNVKWKQQQGSGYNQVVTERSYSAVQTNPGVYAVLPTKEETTHYEGTTINPPSFKKGKEYIYDSFGNAAIVRDYGVYGDASDDVDTCTQWMNDTSSWQIAYPRYSYVADSCTITNGACNCAGYKQKTERYGNANYTEVYEYDDQNWVFLRTAYTYDVNGNVTTKTVPGLVIANTSYVGQIIDYTTYDPDYRTFPIAQTRQGGPLSLTTTFAYEPRFGTLAAQTDANGNTITTQFDGLGRVAASSATSPTGYVTPVVRIGWGSDATGKYRITSERNAWETDDWRWQREYLDGRGRSIRTEAQSTNSAKPIVVKREFDVHGEVKKESMPFFLGDPEAYTIYTRDWLGRMNEIIDPSGTKTTISYVVNTSTCAKCVLAETTIEGVGPSLPRTTMRYLDVDGHVLRQVDADNRVTTYAYDKRGRQVLVSDDAGTTTTQYDSLGRVVSSTSPDRGTITNTYDAGTGWLRSTVDGNGQLINYSHDGFGRVTQKQVVGKETVSFTYDNPAYPNTIGRLSNVSIVPAGQSTPTSTNAFAYSPDGKITANTIGIDATTYTVSSTYDPQGRLRTFTYPDGSVQSRQYNTQGMLASISIDGSIYAQYSNYSPSGQPGSSSYANGTQTSLTYDQASRLSTSKTLGPNSTSLLDYAYSWDALHRITTLQDLRDSTRSQTFTYSAAGQLKKAIGKYGTLVYEYDGAGNLTSKEGVSISYTGHRATSGTNFTATYDAAGNRNAMTRNGVAWTYQFGAENRLLSVTKNGALVNQFAYDFTGERIKKVDANLAKTHYVTQNYEAAFMPDGRKLLTKYINDASGRVAALTTEIPAQASSVLDVQSLDTEQVIFNKRSLAGLLGYAHNRALALRAHPLAKPIGLVAASIVLVLAAAALLRRRAPEGLAKALTSLKAALLPPATEYTRKHPLFALAMPLVLCSFMAACNPVQSENLATTQDELTAGANGEGYPIAGTFFFHNNHLSSASLVTNASGAEIARTEYKPYGEIDQSSSPGVDMFRSKFTGKEWDKDSELYYYSARYYDPILGRFLSADPLVYGGSDRETNALNPYAYANNNPVVYTDPSGHLFFLVVLVAVVVGAYAGGMSTNGTWNCTAWNWNSWQTYVGIGVGGIVGGFSAGLGAGVGGFGGAMLTTALDSVVINGLQFLSPQGSTLENFGMNVGLDLALGAVTAGAGSAALRGKNTSALTGAASKSGGKATQKAAEKAVQAAKPKLSSKLLEAASDLGGGVWSVGTMIANDEARQRLLDTGANGNGPRNSAPPIPMRADGSSASDFFRSMSDAMLGSAGAGDMGGRLSTDWGSARRSNSRAAKRAPETNAGFAVAF